MSERLSLHIGESAGKLAGTLRRDSNYARLFNERSVTIRKQFKVGHGDSVGTENYQNFSLSFIFENFLVILAILFTSQSTETPGSRTHFWLWLERPGFIFFHGSILSHQRQHGSFLLISYEEQKVGVGEIREKNTFEGPQ